jgi:hypothetical protein
LKDTLRQITNFVTVIIALTVNVLASALPALAGASLSGTATRWHITGPTAESYNTPGKPRVVDIQRTENLSTSAALRVPPLSCALFVLPLK